MPAPALAGVPCIEVLSDNRGKVVMASLKGSQTEANLRQIFAHESQVNRRYLYFAQHADKEGFAEIAAVFRATAESETSHAHGTLRFLEQAGDPETGEPIGDTLSNLRAAIASETHEANDLYPDMAATARAEGFEDIANWLEALSSAEVSHINRFKRALESLSQDQKRGKKRA